MMPITVVDTDILIDAAMKIDQAVDCLDRIERETVLAISAITQMELLVGCRNKTELRKTGRFIQRFRVIRLNENISDKAVELINQYRLSHGLAIPDAIRPSLLSELFGLYGFKRVFHHRFKPVF
jgi:predicted nucleic acid-binding protein